ncbi:MAG: hypothetical protein ACKOPM_11345 [Novosphingobium sp.]
MKAIFPLVALTALLAACAAPPKPTPVPKPVVVQPRPTLPPPPLPATPADWRDAAQTPGTWNWSLEAGRSTARFGETGTSRQVTLACDRPSGRVFLARSGTSAGSVPMAVATSSTRRPLFSDPALSAGGWLVVAIPANDTLLDAIAFSRGRFALETAGLETLYLPAWPEISRVIEDCR